jgi:hypothetical protein
MWQEHSVDGEPEPMAEGGDEDGGMARGSTTADGADDEDMDAARKKLKVPADALKALRSFKTGAGGIPDGVRLEACSSKLAQVRCQSAALAHSCLASLDRHHREQYPTEFNETYTALVELVRSRLGSSTGAGSLLVGIHAAAAGELARLLTCLQGCTVYQSDLRSGQAEGVYDIATDAWPLDATGCRVAEAQTDVALARNCWYDLYCSFLTLWAMCGTLCRGGTLGICVLPQQMDNVCPFLLEALHVGVLTDLNLKPIRLKSADSELFNAYLINATRTEVSHLEIRQLPTLLASTHVLKATEHTTCESRHRLLCC